MPRSYDALVLAGGLASLGAAAALLTWLPGISSTTVALAFLLLVLGTATFARRRVAIAMAVVATLAYNFLFLPPVGTLWIADAQNWVALAAFLIAAVIASTLSAAARDRADQAVALIRERAAAERVRQKAELASTLLAALSHDLKTPLTAIRLAVENLQTDLPPAERYDRAAAATAELDRLNRLFRDILDMARIDADAMEVQPQWVTPAEIVETAAAHVRHVLDGRTLTITADQETVIEVDPRVASVALSHLLENAARYSPAGAIAVDAQPALDGLRIAVTDHGPGLDPQELDHVFERFYRGRSAGAFSPGSGLGLSITQGLLRAVGGRVWAENVVDGGARFTMVIPGPRDKGKESAWQHES